MMIILSHDFYPGLNFVLGQNNARYLLSHPSIFCPIKINYTMHTVYFWKSPPIGSNFNIIRSDAGCMTIFINALTVQNVIHCMLNFQKSSSVL